MITGHVRDDLALVALLIYGSGGNRLSIEAIVDTGFNDWLILPNDLIAALSLPLIDEAIYRLADGSETQARFYIAEVDWLGQRVEIVVLEMDSAPLIGMAMLRGSHLSIEVRDGGPVTIAPLRNNP